MHILRVAQNLYPEVPGGGTYHVHALSRDQAVMGHDITILTVSDDRKLPRYEERNGYTVVRRSPTFEVLNNEISVGLARYLRDAEDFDVLHAHSHLYFSTNLGAVKSRFSDIPLAITNHGLYSQNTPKWLFNLYLQSAGRWTFNWADVVFCYTDKDRKRVRDFGVNSRIEVVPNGVDTKRFIPKGEENDLIDHDGPVVLFVGRLVKGKRPKDAIKAVSRFQKDCDAKLYIVGDGPLRAELEAMATGGLVEFLGQIPYEDMPSIYRASNVLLLPSRAEGLPRTVLEAFACGIPVVTSHLEHTAPIVEEGGETVEIGDINGYVKALHRVLENEFALGEKGRQRVIDGFRWQGTVEQTTAVLESIK